MKFSTLAQYALLAVLIEQKMSDKRLTESSVHYHTVTILTYTYILVCLSGVFGKFYYPIG